MRPTLLLVLPLASACVVGPSTRIQGTADGRTLSVSSLADAVTDADVVFLGELHDNDEAHRLQLELTRALGERREAICVSLEMFERDVQDELDAYLEGAISEERFLGHSRPWSNYAEHYRPIVELAKARGWPVLAANTPRHLARAVSREGLESTYGRPYRARTVDAGPGEYKNRFIEVMTGMADASHFASDGLDKVFAAQCLKDDTMAESIVAHLALAKEERPLVIHLCGRFHSDYALGTVERLRRRMPHLTIAVVTTETEHTSVRSMPEPDRRVADYVWFVE